QLAGSGYELVKLKVQHAPEYANWLAERLSEGAVVAFDGKLAAVAVAKAVQEKLLPAGIHVQGDVDLFASLWQDRPSLPTNAAYLIDEDMVGESISAKLGRLRRAMKRFGVDAHLISSLDDLAWLFNLR